MDRRVKITALFLTIAVGALTVAALFLLRLTYSQVAEEARQWPPVDSSELLFANDFVATGDVAPDENPDEASEVAASAADREAFEDDDLGETAPQAPAPVSSNRESGMKVKPDDKQKPQGPTREQIAEQQKAKARKETADAIDKRVNFGGKSAGGKSSGTPESQAGSATALTGTASASVGGRSLEKWSRPSGRATGTIRIAVKVDRQGRVRSAVYSSGSGAVAALIEARRSCERAALESQFSVALDGPSVQQGYIVYQFR